MPSDVGEAVLARQGRELPADGPLDPAQVDHDGLAGDPFRVLLHPADDGPGRQGQQEEVAVGEVFIRQRPVNGPAQAGQRHGFTVDVRPPYGVERARLDAFRHGAADEPQADDPEVHAVLSMSCAAA